MNVVPHAGAVRGVVVVAEDAQLGKLAHGHLGDIGHQVVGNAIGVLAHGTALVSADGVEVAQKNHVPLVVRLLDVGENLLQHGLGPAVRVGAFSFGAVLGDGDDGGIAVHGGAGGEDDVLHIVLPHDVHQGQCACDVVLIIFPGLLHRLSHCLQPGEVDHRVDAFFGEDFLQGRSVQDVRFVEGDFFPGDGFHPRKGFLAGIAEVVQNYYFVVCLLQFYHCMAADEPGAACDQNLHSILFSARALQGALGDKLWRGAVLFVICFLSFLRILLYSCLLNIFMLGEAGEMLYGCF